MASRPSYRTALLADLVTSKNCHLAINLRQIGKTRALRGGR